jgi:hypothetical protein
MARWRESKNGNELGMLQHEYGRLQREHSIVRELLSRIVEQQRTITFDSSSPVPTGELKWESVQTEAGSQQTTIWFVPNESDNNGGAG